MQHSYKKKVLVSNNNNTRTFYKQRHTLVNYLYFSAPLLKDYKHF